MDLYSDSARHGSVNYVIKKSVSRTGEGMRDGCSHRADCGRIHSPSKEINVGFDHFDGDSVNPF